MKMMKPFVLILSLMLAACVGGARTAAAPTQYDFGPSSPRLEGVWPRLSLDVRSPSWLASRDIAYRLAYEDPLKLRRYADSRWAAEPEVLLGDRLRQQLAASGPSGGAAVACLLRVELQEFVQVFDSPQQSRGVLRTVVNVIDARRQILAEKTVFIEQPAVSADARGGVGALVSAGDLLGRQLAEWLESEDRRGSFKVCQPK